jgi:nucleotide-binding universal stress UspA family protein
VRGARVDVVGSWSVPPLAATGVGMVPAFDLLRAELGDSVRQVLAVELADAADAAAGIELHQVVAQGDAAGALVETAAGADLLVVGSRGRGSVAGTVLGSVSRACLLHAPCPVAVVHHAGPTERSRIVVGVDGSPGARAALDWAYAEARLRDVGVYAVCAYDEPWAIAAAGMSSAAAVAELRTALAVEADGVLEAAREEAPDSVGVTGEAIRSAAGPALVGAAEGSALLVVGSRGRGGFKSLLLGSVSQYCAAHARGIVVVVRGS